MKSRSLSSAIAVTAALIAIVAAIQWGTTRVSGYSRAVEGQNQDSTQQRRSKNGTPVASAPKADATAAPSSETSPPDQGDRDRTTSPGTGGSGGDAQDRTANQDRAANQDRTAGKDSGQSAGTGSVRRSQSENRDSQNSVSDPLGSRTSRTSHSGPEPPPFDRPPLISRT